MENIASVLEIGKLTWSLVGHQIGYITNPEKKIEELDKNAQYLFARRDDVEVMITREPPNVAARESKLWLEDVKKAELNVKSIQEDHTRRPNVYSRMKLGKRVGDAIEEISNLNDKRPKLKGKEFSNAPLDRVEQQIVEINPSTDSGPRLQKILGLIEDVRFRRIGIWGMGGVGKTRTLKLLNNHPDVSSTFEIVIWVTISKNVNRRKMQNEIAHRLNLGVSNVSDDQLQATICKTLRRRKFLLLLDDLWEKIDLPDVGIPSLDEDNGSKVVFTTRSLGVCRRMETDEDVRVETLPKDEAWCLFSQKAGDVAMFPHINPIARLIVEECGGLPLAIIVVGSSLRKINDAVVWKNILMELEVSQCEAMDEPVYRCLRFSYDRLQNEWKKNLFLFCSLYPEDWEIPITNLAEYCWVEGYIHGVGSIQEAREKGHRMAIDLIDASLLERCEKGWVVKMHDVVRDFALTEGRGFLVKAGMKIMHPPGEDEWLQSQKISLMRSTTCSLLERPNCGILTTLLLQYCHQIRMIPDSFFELMVSLTTLDLSGTNLQMLPSSVGNLVNLRGLYLRDCESLRDLPSQVRLLIRLEVLDLGGFTQIKYLPREIGELIGLKRLMVGFKRRFRSDHFFITAPHSNEDEEWDMNLRVPIGIIPNLPLLEELGMYTHGCAEKDQWDDESMVFVVDELCRLERLTFLDFYFPNVDGLAHFLNESKTWKARRLEFFRFRVGPLQFYERTDEAWTSESCLVYDGGNEISHPAIKETLARCSYFQLSHHHAIQKLSEFGMANMNELKMCRIRGCDKMEFLFDGDEGQQTCAMLPNLEELVIADLSNLRRLWVGQLLAGSLSKLTHLKIRGCHSHLLKKVFQVGMIQQLPSLECLEIRGSSAEVIIGIEEETFVPYYAHISNNYNVILPNIRRIVLHYLPRLVSFCRGVSLEWPSLESISIYECRKLKSLSFLTHGTNNVPPALKVIEGPRVWWEALEWEDDTKQRLQPLFRSNSPFK